MSVFPPIVLFLQTDQSLQAAVQIPAHDLAVITATSCFEKADENKDGQLSFEEFHAWFSGSEAEQLGSVARMSCEWHSLSPSLRISPPPPLPRARLALPHIAFLCAHFFGAVACFGSPSLPVPSLSLTLSLAFNLFHTHSLTLTLSRTHSLTHTLSLGSPGRPGRCHPARPHHPGHPVRGAGACQVPRGVQSGGAPLP